jgi:Heparinase II/III-like protein/Heparinase II/III N-terminus
MKRIRRRLTRLSRMDGAELLWRTAASARIALDRARTAVRQPRWDRRQLQSILTEGCGLDGIHRVLGREHWLEAHCRLSHYFANSPQRFPLSHSAKTTLTARIRDLFPNGPVEAVSRADHLHAGEYDVLGYQRLRFNPRDAGPPDRMSLPDWHFDPVHDRHPPRRFWSTVNYLHADCGDHKIVWELNRHQHWLALGRAYWLSNDRRYRARFCAELSSWLESNPPLTGINWASMLELALRSVSWIWSLHFFVEDDGGVLDAHGGDHEPWTVDLLLALDRQLTHVERNLSLYFSPNTHLLGEALSLYVAGRALPEFRASTRRANLGRSVLLAEMARQICRDGGHCERSAHYHRYACDFYILALVIARLTHDPAAPDFERAVMDLARAARLLADDHGRLPHVGDDDGGVLFPIAGRASDDLRDTLAIAAALLGRPDLAVGPAPEEALWMLGPQFQIGNSPFQIPHSQCQIPSAALPNMGYYISRSFDGSHLVIDGGPHGYQNGGHAHADALSLTLTVRGMPLLVDAGTGCYTTDSAVRDRLRSSALHNTLTLDHHSQSTPAGPFHWLRVANGHVHRWCTNGRFDYFDGSHDGYSPGSHRRRVLAIHGDLLVVSDFVEAAGEHTAAVHWHVDPAWNVAAQGHRVTFSRPIGTARVPPAGIVGPGASTYDMVTLVTAQGHVETFHNDGQSGLGLYSPVYGRMDALTTVRLSHRAAGPFWIGSVFDLSSQNPIDKIEWVPVWSTAGRLAHAAALRIARAASTDYVLFAEPFSSGTSPHDLERAAAHLWRAGEIETDACMLFCRVESGGRIACIGLVDGSIVRGIDGSTQLALPERTSDVYLDLSETKTAALEDRLPGTAFDLAWNRASDRN